MIITNSSATFLLQHWTETSLFTFYSFLLVSKVGRLQCHMESNMPFAGENVTCSYSCTPCVGTGRYIVRSILISIMLRRSHVIIMANLSQADDGHEDMTMGHKGTGVLHDSQFISLLSGTRNTLQQWNIVICKRIYKLCFFVFGLDIPCTYCPTAWSCRTYFAFLLMFC